MICLLKLGECLKSLVSICTKNRPEEVIRLVNSMKYQTKPPDEILIVDSTQLDMKQFYVSRGLRNNSVTVHSITMSLIEARKFSWNYALKNNFEILHFLDDDTILTSRYLENIMSSFDKRSFLLGTGGIVLDNFERNLYSFFYDLIRVDGRVTKFGNGIATYNPKTLKVFWLPGCSMSYRVSSLQEHDFDMRLKEIGSMGEDLHISNSIAKRGNLMRTPNAILFHYQSAINRPSMRNWNFRVNVQREIFLKKSNVRFVNSKILIYLMVRLLATVVLHFRYRSAPETFRSIYDYYKYKLKC